MAVVMVVAIALGWLGATVVLRVAYAGKILPGTEVAGRALGGRSEQDARARLRSLRPAGSVVTVSHRGRRWVIRGAGVGLRVDARATARRALRAGRHGSLGGATSSLIALVSPRSVEPVYTPDPRAVRRVVADIAGAVDVGSFRGGLEVDPESLRVDVMPPRAGRVVDRRSLTREIRAVMRRGINGVIALPTRRAPTVERHDVEQAARDAAAYVAAPLHLAVGRRRLTLSAQRVATILGLEVTGSARGPGVRLGVEPGRLASLVEWLSARSDRPAVDARIAAAAAPVLVDAKRDLRWRPRRAAVRVSPGRPGRALDRSAAAAAIAAAIRAGDHDAALPTRVVRPRLSTRAARRVRRLVGTFTTHFECCEARVTNIRRIARAVDGTVVLPGERFSLNRVAGRRTRRGGYVPAPFIADGKIVPSVGGGVSQFSTTVYNAAYFAGLQIDYHQPHSIYISRYPPGREATLDFGSIDLTWTNDTAAPILVRTATTATSVAVTLYGDNGGRRVRAAAGPRRPLAGRDFAITVTRSISYPDGRVVRQSYTTAYDKPPEPE